MHSDDSAHRRADSEVVEPQHTRHTGAVPGPTVSERALPWVVRAAWVGVLLSGGRAIDDATGSDATVAWLAFVGWVAGVAALAVHAVVTLTATRVVVPVSVVAAVVTWASGASAVNGAVFTGAALVATVVALSSDFGRVFVQSSAYGDEDRYLLRPPLAYLMVAVLAWSLWAAATVGAGVAVATGHVVTSVVLLVVVAAGAVLGFPRWHLLARRWIVLVPAGVVVHDHLVLAETLMVRRADLARLGLAPAGTDAADLTGPATGHAIEIRTHTAVTALLGITPDHPGGQAIHLTGCLVAPGRPGRVLEAAERRRFPVGAIS
jgi:hypothetical protein